MDKINRRENELKDRERRILDSICVSEGIKEKNGRDAGGDGNHGTCGGQRRDGRKKRGTCKRKWTDHQLQCQVLGILALILACLAVFQEAGRRSEPDAQSQNRIITAAGGMEAGANDSAALLLVNKDHALPADYEPELHWLKNGRVAVAEEMYDSLSAMLTDGSEDGREFVVASGYRSYEYQQQLLEEDVQAAMERYGMSRQEAYELESRETMPEGHSEHETGLAVDIVALDYQILDEAQEYTEENQWLREHCHEYGFILRYPRGKESVTGISYESWHFRYVGTEAAREITERGITLEEYLEGRW